MGKVALVLSGGAAKGAYEAGVLLALAEKRVHPDVIVGISSGAINGAYLANLLAAGHFTPAAVKRQLIHMWVHDADAKQIYGCYDPSAAPDPDQAESLHNIGLRLGIDPFERRYLPKIGLESLGALRKLLSGRFQSLMSMTFLQAVLDQFLQPPASVVRPILLAVGVCNLQGETRISDLHIQRQYSRYLRFSWEDGRSPGEWAELMTPLRQAIVASASFPLVFPPASLAIDGGAGSYVDGGFVESSPISQAIKSDPEVDKVFVVMAATGVSSPERPPETFLEVISRIFNILAGSFLTANYYKVIKANQQLVYLNQVLDRDKKGQVRDNARNDLICRAAGLDGVDEYRRRRIIQVIPIFPDLPLEGDLFAGFFDQATRQAYVDRGYQDALAVMAQKWDLSRATRPLVLPQTAS